MKLFLLTLSLVIVTGCSAFRKPIRPYYEQEPTVGGSYPEGQMLGGQDYYDEYRSGRAPASSQEAPKETETWAGQNQEAAEYRDAQRPSISYAQAQNVNPNIIRQYRNGTRATRADFVDDSQNESSLWASGGQTNYFFTKNKIRSVGDIVTLTAEEPLIRSIAIELRKTLDEKELEAEIETTKTKFKNKALAAKKGTDDKKKKPDEATTAAAEEEEEVEIPEPQFSDIDVTEQMGIKAGEPMMAEIAERFPNGNYKLRVIKKVPYRGQERMMSMLSIVKGSELEETDTVASGKLYEYRIKVFR